MPTLKQLRVSLGWTVTRLAEESNLARQSVASAEKGGTVQATTAKALADALSKGYGREIMVWQIEGLNIL
jgi:transcriptional regulator with XRE-family HTH domain